VTGKHAAASRAVDDDQILIAVAIDIGDLRRLRKAAHRRVRRGGKGPIRVTQQQADGAAAADGNGAFVHDNQIKLPIGVKVTSNDRPWVNAGRIGGRILERAVRIGQAHTHVAALTVHDGQVESAVQVEIAQQHC